MQPIPKDPAIVALIEKMTGRKRTGTHCQLCGSDAMQPSDFRDDLSRREAAISCMCQVCQESTFGTNDE